MPEHKGESIETLVGDVTDQNNNTGVIASSDDPQDGLVEATATESTEPAEPPAPPLTLIPMKAVDLLERFLSDDMDTASDGAALATQVAKTDEDEKKAEMNPGERRQKQPRRFLILSGPALVLLRKAGPDLGHIGVNKDTMDAATRTAVQRGEVPDAPRDAEQLETSDVALVENLMIATFAHVRGRHVALSAITDPTEAEVTCSAMSPTGVDATLIPATTSAVKSMGRIGLPDRAVIEARRRMEAETLDDIIASIPSIAPFLESSETYTEEVGEDGNAVQAGEKIQNWFDRLSAITTDPNVPLLMRKNIVRSAIHGLATELLKPEMQRVTGFTLNRIGMVGVNLEYLKEGSPKEESERRGLYLPLTTEEGGRDRWKRIYCVPAFPNEPMEVIHLLRDLQRRVDISEGRR